MHAPFTNIEAFEQRFAAGLEALMAAHRSLGAYILVLANAAYAPELWNRLAPALARRHTQLTDEVSAALRRGDALAEPEDDVLVFLKLSMIGFAHLGRMESHREGPWHFMFNPLRALRPPRASGLAFERLHRPFDPSGFHFNKPFLAKEVLWHGALSGKDARLLYNKFPFASLHSLLVPDPLRQLPQYLTPEWHGWAWDICAQSALPGLCLGYNSYGAGASVNHLHFQSFVQAGPLPIQDTQFIHNGGARAYPLPCLRFTDREAAWFHLDQLHQQNIPYNLIYSQACLYLVARVPQDSGRLNAQSRSYGWSEMAGAVTRFSRDAFENQNAADFEAELANFAP